MRVFEGRPPVILKIYKYSIPIQYTYNFGKTWGGGAMNERVVQS